MLLNSTMFMQEGIGNGLLLAQNLNVLLSRINVQSLLESCAVKSHQRAELA